MSILILKLYTRFYKMVLDKTSPIMYNTFNIK